MTTGAHDLWTGYGQTQKTTHHSVSMIVEDKESGETTVYRFPDIENFKVGLLPLDADDDSKEWGILPVPGLLTIPPIMTVATSGIVRNDEHGHSLKVTILPK